MGQQRKRANAGQQDRATDDATPGRTRFRLKPLIPLLAILSLQKPHIGGTKTTERMHELPCKSNKRICGTKVVRDEPQSLAP
jgi:hypothetical protein